MKEEKIEINVSKLIKFSLSFEQYFILQCINSKNQNLLETYVSNKGSFDKEIFNQLIEKGYLFPIDSQIIYDVLKLTAKYYDDFEFNKELEHQKWFAELREIYPKRVKGRALHTNLANCQKKYKEFVTTEKEHRLVLECLKLYVSDLTKTGKLEYMQMLSTYINQKSWEAYIDEVGKHTEEETSYTAI